MLQSSKHLFSPANVFLRHLLGVLYSLKLIITSFSLARAFRGFCWGFIFKLCYVRNIHISEHAQEPPEFDKLLAILDKT